jgi:hypothetical protein
MDEPQRQDNGQMAGIITKIVENAINPIVGGIAFGLAWLGTFYLLKKKLDIS